MLADPRTGVALAVSQSRNVRSRCRCSVCPAIHINSRSWLRSSSTHEPSDPPHRVVVSDLNRPGPPAQHGQRVLRPVSRELGYRDLAFKGAAARWSAEGLPSRTPRPLQEHEILCALQKAVPSPLSRRKNVGRISRHGDDRLAARQREPIPLTNFRLPRFVQTTSSRRKDYPSTP